MKHYLNSKSLPTSDLDRWENEGGSVSAAVEYVDDQAGCLTSANHFRGRPSHVRQPWRSVRRALLVNEPLPA